MMGALLLAGLAGSLAAASPYTGGRTPWTLPAGDGVVGVFHPLAVGIGHDTEIATTGLVSLVAPRLEVKRTLLQDDTWGLALRAGLSVPTPGLRLLRGYLLPTDAEVPWAVVAGVGPVVGWRQGDWNVSGALWARAGLPGDLFPTRDLFWWDPMVAPLVDGFALRARLTADWHPGAWVVTADGSVQLGGGPDLDGTLFVLRGLGDHLALGAGVAGAAETREDGFRAYAVPIADLQGRW